MSDLSSSASLGGVGKKLLPPLLCMPLGVYLGTMAKFGPLGNSVSCAEMGGRCWRGCGCQGCSD